MVSKYGWLARYTAQRGLGNRGGGGTPGSYQLGLGLLPSGPAAGPLPGGQYRRALAQAARVAAMPPIGMGGLGASPAAAGANTANATAALFGGAGARPSYGGNSFLLGHPGGAYAGGRYTDPGVRYRQAMGQGTNALLGVMSAPGGDAPDGPQRRALRASARALAAAKADLDAEMSLTFTGYGPLERGDPATRAEAARLARKLGFDQYGPPGTTTAWPPRGRGGGAASLPGVGTPPWRFGMGGNPYLYRHLSAGSDTGRYNDSHAGGPGNTAPTAPPHMVREGFYAATRAAAARLAAQLGVASPASRGATTATAVSPWLGVPPSLAASGYGTYKGHFNYPNRWLDLPRSKLPDSTLPESGADFRAMIAMQEHQPDIKQVHELHTTYDYDPEEHGGKGQYGLYQLTPGELYQLGATDAQGNWNPDYYPGINSHSEFVNDPIAQQRVFHDAMRDYDRQLASKGTYDFLGQTITGLEGDIVITEAGLLGAAHRQGAGATRDYLRHQERYGNVTENWINDVGKVSADDAEAFRRVERRLRLLQKTPYN